MALGNTVFGYISKWRIGCRQVGDQPREMNMYELSKDLRNAANQPPVARLAKLKELTQKLGAL